MAKKIYDEKINKSQDWGGDESTGNLPVAGNRVQEFIKEQLNSKAGVFYYDTANNRYIVFADSESQDAYLADPTKTELIIGAFDAPFNYSAQITLSSPTYVSILSGTKNNYIDFTFDTMNKSGQSVGEDVICTYTIIKGGIKKTVTEKYRYGQAAHFNIDEYLSVGTNTITVGIVGQTTLAATTIGITYQVVDLQLSDTYDISQSYNIVSNPAAAAAIPYAVSGYGTKIMEWYLDGVLLDYVKVEDEIVDVSTTRTKYIPLANLSQGIHSLQYRAYTMLDGERFYSNILYRDLIVVTGANNNPIIAVSATIPVDNDIITSGNLQLFGITQYIPYELNFAVYNPSSTASTDAVIAVDGKVEATIQTHNNEVTTYSLRPTDYGVKSLTITSGTTVYTIGMNVSKSSTSLEPVTDGLQLDLMALGKSNNDVNKEEWVYGLYSATFSGFNWNKTSGWNNNRLMITSGAYVDINLAPLSPDPTATGKTLEFEFSTANVSDDNAVICDLRNTSGTGLLITASEVKLKSAGGAEVSTKFKSEENIRIAFVINKKSGVANKGLVFIYVNGELYGAVNYSSTDNFTSDKMLRIGNTNLADVQLKALRFYNAALNHDQILNNYILYRDTTEELLSIYDKNAIYEEGTQNFSVDKLAAQCPVFIFTGDIPALENTTDKNKTIYVDVEYINMQDPSRSFTGKGIRLRPQGTSSMGYPKKNFRPYTGYGTMWDSMGKVLVDGLYSFAERAQPVNVWCLKADYAESSGTHNTGIARLWNQVMYDAQINGEYVLRTEAQKAAIAAGYPYDVRTTVDGFPCNVFYRLTADSELVYIGKYNFNNDKSTESVFGFRDIPGFDNSKVQCWEVLNNGNHLALFQDMDNFDTEWDQAYEARYPDKSTNVADLKAFSEWVVSTKGDVEKFKAEKWHHLDVYKVAAYYIYLMRFGAVDQPVKNAMLTSEDGKKFFYINYDNDTINAKRNDGLLIYNYDIDRQTVDTSFSALVYAYAGHESTLWNNLEADDEFMRIVSEVDNALYIAGLSYEKTIDMFDNKQAGKWCERVYNQDAQYKYIGPYTDSGINNLFMLQGSCSAHRRWWLSHRFDLFDSKFVSGAYKAKSIEFKAANAPAGLEFSIVSGNNLYYGYGLNNVPVETGVRLPVGVSHTFTTKQVINVGDPVRVYSAVNIKEMDVSNFIEYLSTLNIAEVYNSSVGTKLKKLVMGVDTAKDGRRNTSLLAISGLSQATRLEYLDISGYKGITELNLSTHTYLNTLKAFASGLTGLVLANGAPVTIMELPDTMQAIALDNLPSLQASGLKIDNEWKSVISISIRNCKVLQAAPLIFDWYSKKTTDDSQCSLVLDGIEWEKVDAASLINLGNIKKSGGTFSIKGTIHLVSVTPAQVDELKAIFGNNCFNSDNEIFITAPDGVFLAGPAEVLEGANTQYTATVFSDNKGRVEFWLVNSNGTELESIGEDSINKSTGLLTTGLTNSNRNFKIRVKHIPTQGNVSLDEMTVSVVKRLHPSSGIIDGPSRVVLGDNDYILNLTNPSGTVTGDYQVVWSITGDAVNQGFAKIKSQDKKGCIITITEVPGDIVSFTLTANIRNTFTAALVLEKNIDIFMDGVIMTKTTNPEAMKICFAQGWAANENFMTEEEAAAVTDIGIAFRNNYYLISFEEFKYFTGVTNIANEAFYQCSRLTTIAFPPYVTSVGDSVFYYCTSLVTVSLNSSIVSIGKQMFYDCKALIEVVIPQSVKAIGERMFLSCQSLKKVTLPNNVTSINTYEMFRGCYKLEGVILPSSGMITLSGRTFAYCNKLQYINIPSTVGFIGYNCFEDCSLLQEIDLSKTAVNEFYEYTFKNCISLKKVLFPDTFIKFGQSDFYGCIALTSFEFPPMTTELGSNTFAETSIETIEIPINAEYTVSSYGTFFRGMNKLASFKVAAGHALYRVKDDGCLYDITGTKLLGYPPGKISKVYTLPEDVITIGEQAFYGLDVDVIGKFVFNTNLQRLESGAFGQCKILDEILDLSGTQLNCINRPFAYSKIKKVIFPATYCPTVETVNDFGKGGLSQMYNLESYELPDTITAFPESFFESSGNENSVHSFPPNLKQVGNYCFRQSGFKEVILPDTVTTIGSNMCDNSWYITKFIARNVSKILSGNSAANMLFYNCNILETIVLGNIQFIGSRFIYKCQKLKSLSINALTAPTYPKNTTDIFGNSDSSYAGKDNPAGTNILYVPVGATGYDVGLWLDPLQDETKCKFTISYTL